MLKGFKLVSLLAATLFFGCSSQPTVKPVSVNKVLEAVAIPDLAKSANDYIALAQQDWRIKGDVNSRNALLLNAAHLYQQQGECNRAMIILKRLRNADKDSLQAQQVSMYGLECMLLLHAQNPQNLTLAKTMLADVTHPALSARKTIALAHIAALSDNYYLASQALVSQVSEASVLHPSGVQTLWDWFNHLSTQQQQALQASSTEFLPYFELASIIDDSQINDDTRQLAITDWLARYPRHPMHNDLPVGIAQFMQTPASTINKIAVLLPLSGRLEAQGDAIKQGVLAAYFRQLSYIQEQDPGARVPSIRFYDTGSEAQTFADSAITPDTLNQYDLVIGPLLKEQIQQVQAFNLSHPSLLFLNRLEESSQAAAKDVSVNDMSAEALTSASKQGLYYALSPEDEGAQLASLMQQQALRAPIIISNGSSVSQRMQDAFLSQWQKHSAQQDGQASQPNVINFTSNKSMRIGITSALDVLQSQRRIAQLSNLTTERVHSVTRNRRDIDAFVVFAKPDEIELINPIIEASISLFTDTSLPVYATSYSYQHQLNKNSIRDLRNLVFIDMPWLMPNYRQSDLAQQVDRVWNQPSSAFLRLFAFGYDSYQFTGKVQQQLIFKSRHIDGLSGQLSIDSNNQVIRKLPRATVTLDAIVVVDAI